MYSNFQSCNSIKTPKVQYGPFVVGSPIWSWSICLMVKLACGPYVLWFNWFWSTCFVVNLSGYPREVMDSSLVGWLTSTQIEVRKSNMNCITNLNRVVQVWSIATVTTNQRPLWARRAAYRMFYIHNYGVANGNLSCIWQSYLPDEIDLKVVLELG